MNRSKQFLVYPQPQLTLSLTSQQREQTPQGVPQLTRACVCEGSSGFRLTDVELREERTPAHFI